MDKDYWKKAYQDMWEDSSKREIALARWIERLTGRRVEIIGLGAGTSEFISGSAEEHGHDKGDADLHIIDTNLYVEVTGPLTSKVPASDPLWFRPDKFNNAVKHARLGHDTFFAHHCPAENLWRVIHIDQPLIDRLLRHEFPVIHPRIRGRVEDYVEVPAKDSCVQPLEFLARYLLKHVPQPTEG